MICEYCNIEFFVIKYGAGRFCSSVCSHKFSSNTNRVQANLNISKKLKKKNYVCFCGKDAAKGAGGSTINCIEHKRKQNVPFEDLKDKNARKRFLLKEINRMSNLRY